MRKVYKIPANYTVRRAWAMPNASTFTIKPIEELIKKYLYDAGGTWLDPFAGQSPFRSLCISNDLNPDFRVRYHLESLEFLKQFYPETAEGVLFDPPYSPRQISECYKNIGTPVQKEDTQSKFYALRKDEIGRVVRPGGYVLSFGWNSNGLGIRRGFQIVEVLLVAHGADRPAPDETRGFLRARPLHGIRVDRGDMRGLGHGVSWIRDRAEIYWRYRQTNRKGRNGTEEKSPPSETRIHEKKGGALMPQTEETERKQLLERLEELHRMENQIIEKRRPR